jgi:RNA-directed DNA polymerase
LKRSSSSNPREQSVLEMNSAEAREFLLKPESYCTVEFPPYLQFGRLLSTVLRVIGNSNVKGMQKDKPRNYELVNYPLLSNKDGRHAWRPLQLINPALYISLVNQVTSKSNWNFIRARFAEFQAVSNSRCLSIPVRSRTTSKDKAAQIFHWWQGVEQASIELALDYAYVFHADVTDCYAAIYTHSIAWALHGKATAKAKRADMP